MASSDCLQTPYPLTRPKTLAYCLHVTLKQRARALAAGLTPRSIIEKLSTIQMVDLHLPTADGRHLILSRYTDPEPDLALLLQMLQLELPQQPPPKVSSTVSCHLN